MQKYIAAILLLPAALAPVHGHAQQVLEQELSTEYQDLRLVRIAEASHPWGITFLDSDRILFTERQGRLYLVQGSERIRVEGTPEVHARNQGGLLDVVAHPQYASNGWIYMTYSKGTADSTTTALGRARLEGTRLVGFEEIFVSNAWGRPGGHYGSRIVFNGDGTMFVSIGDRMRDPERAQNPADHAGSILRLREDGSVPDDNPFIGRAGYAPELYSYGHRNIQGMTRHPATGELWAFEHGPRGSDLLHRVGRGGNHGWPMATRGRDYRTQEPFLEAMNGVDRRAAPAAAYVDAVHEFVLTIAPSGLTTISGGNWDETWQGNLIGGGLRAQRLVRMVIEDGELVHAEELLTQRIGRIRDVRLGPDGFLYVATDEEDGGIYRIEPVN
jgi:aldose sugar dehydrogenase